MTHTNRQNIQKINATETKINNEEISKKSMKSTKSMKFTKLVHKSSDLLKFYSRTKISHKLGRLNFRNISQTATEIHRMQLIKFIQITEKSK